MRHSLRVWKSVCSGLIIGVACCRIVADASTAPAAKAGWLRLNDLFGVPIWSDYLLWDDAERAVARRLGLPEESRTSVMAGYHAYPGGKTKILGEPCYSFSMLCDSAHVTSISIVFANKGDVVGLQDGAHMVGGRPVTTVNYKPQIAAAATNVERVITSLLRAPKVQTYGEKHGATREEVKRWDVKGHAILLAAPADEYVLVRIVPTADADAEGRTPRISSETLRTLIAARVTQRANGDVVITDIPMIHQGPKGYCVPATWARYCLYLGIPADMYVLAMAAETGAGGGTTLEGMVANINWLIYKHGRHIKSSRNRPLVKHVATYINAGMPVMWPLCADTNFYFDTLLDRSARRRDCADIQAWNSELQASRRAARSLRPDPTLGHICMIIGYNKTTRELAISDSWGALFEERWITEEEADAISFGKLYIIQW